MKRAVRANGRLCFCDLRGIAGAGELSARGRHGGRGVTALTMRRTGGKPPFAQCGGNTCSGSTSSPAARGGVASRSQLPSVVRGCANTRTRAGAWGRGRACHAWPGTRTEKPTGRCTGSAKCLLLAVQARAEGAEVIPAMRREGLRYPNFADDGGAGRKPSQDGWRGRV